MPLDLCPVQIGKQPQLTTEFRVRNGFLKTAQPTSLPRQHHLWMVAIELDQAHAHIFLQLDRQPAVDH